MYIILFEGSLSGSHGYRFRIGGIKTWRRKKKARIIVGHVRPDHIDEASEHCDIISFGFVTKRDDDLILTLTCYEQKQVERKLFPHLVPRKREACLAHWCSSKKDIADALDADLYLA